MPTIKLTVPKASWSKEAKEKIVHTLTDGLNTVAHSEGKGDIKQFISVQIEETAEGGYAIGGQVFG